MNRKFNTTPERSKVMASIRSKETTPEIIMRKELWKQEIRNYRKYTNLPGKPDLCFNKQKLIVFIDGCFWHGCKRHFRKPKNNRKYWHAKIESNIKRKKKVNYTLRKKGFMVKRFWEHQVIKNPKKIAASIKFILEKLH